MDLQAGAEASIRMVREAPLIVYDSETSGLDWRRNFPVGHVVCDGKHSTYTPIRHGGGGNLPDPALNHTPETATASYVIHPYEAELQRAFSYRRSNNMRTVGHHIKFDCHMAANVGVLLGRNLSCTSNTETLINEQRRKYDLESIADSYGVTAKRSEDMYQHLASLFGGPADKSAMANFWMTSGIDPMVQEYATGDGVTTFEVYQAQLPKVEEQELDRVWDVENRLVWTLFRMERRGIRINVEYLDKLEEMIGETVAELMRGLPDGFNVRSPRHMQSYVSQFRTDWPLTAAGNPSFTEKWLKTFPEGQRIAHIRKWTTLLTTFVLPLKQNHVFNGRVHPTFTQNKMDDSGTIAGRLSCINPNLQAVPKHDKETAKVFREAFEADEDYELVEMDYKQCEPRLFAHYSKDKRLVEGYSATPSIDAHSIVAEMFKVDRGTTGKRMNMGMFTGMYPRSFSEHMQWDLKYATEMWNKWFDLFPGVKGFQSGAKSTFMRRGYVKTLLGRRARLDHKKFAYRAVSRIIQGGNADILKYKMVQLDEIAEEMEDTLQLLLSVHDSFVLQMRPEAARGPLLKEIEQMLIDVQTPPFALLVPFEMDVGIGKTWREASFS